MPHTINGIGTHYYGARERSARLGTCQSCGRDTTLSSYSTREWFCVIFIPVIPLKKYRVVDDCTSCRKHYRVPLEEYTAQLDEATGPLRETLRRSPNDPDAYAQLVRTLAVYNKRDEAAVEIEAALSRHPNDVGLNLLAAELACDAANYTGALPFYERAYALQPQTPDIAYGYGWVLNHLGRHEQAIPPLQRAAGHESTRDAALYLLGDAQMKLSRFQDALQSLQQLASVQPAYASDKNFLRMIADCKKRLGYELTPAERSAGRRWWPFGGKKKQPQQLAAQPVMVRPALRYAGIAIAVLMVAALGFTAWDDKTNIDVYFDNALQQGVTIDLDGERFTLNRDSFVKKRVKEGRHQVVVRDAKGKEIEKHAFDVEELGFIDAMIEDRIFVYNVASERIYRRMVVGYAKNEVDRSFDESYVVMKRFFEQRDVDYPFSDAPTEIKAETSSRSVRKVAFNVARDVDLGSYVMWRAQQGKAAEARSIAHAAVEMRPCDADTRRMHVAVARVTGSADDAVKAAREWIGACAQDDLEAHRLYQELHMQRGLHERMRTEYAAKVEREPQSGKAHYLYGRMLIDGDKAVEEYTTALRLDPTLIWPRIAIGSRYATDDRWPEAMRAYAEALDAKGCGTDVCIYYAAAAASNGTPAEALPLVERFRAANRADANAMEARFILAMAAKDWDAAAEMQKALRKHEPDEVAWWRHMKLLRMRGDEAALARETAKALTNPQHRGDALRLQIMRAIEQNDTASLPELIDQGRKELDGNSMAMMQLYAAGVFTFAGDAAAATKMLDGAEQSLGEPVEEQWLLRTLLAGARGTKPIEEVLSRSREASSMDHAWFVSAMRTRDRARAVADLERAARATGDLEFPHLELKAMAARLR